MPTGKSVSFCAPASYWYLRGYSISKMADAADYIVFMTIPTIFKANWTPLAYANQYAVDGCLRSQVNVTKTLQTWP